MRYHASSFAFVSTLQRARAHLESQLRRKRFLPAGRITTTPRVPPSSSQGRVERSLPRRNRIKSGMAMHPYPRERERTRGEEEQRDSIPLEERTKFQDWRSIVRGSFLSLLFGNSGLFTCVYRIPLFSLSLSLRKMSSVFLFQRFLEDSSSNLSSRFFYYIAWVNWNYSYLKVLRCHSRNYYNKEMQK